jgi:hypothetical protein
MVQDKPWPHDQIAGLRKSVAITASDTDTYAPPLRGVYVGGAGDLVVVLSQDTDADARTLAVEAGDFIGYLRIKKVMAATTATGLWGGW